jgi:hypothetical protein
LNSARTKLEAGALGWTSSRTGTIKVSRCIAANFIPQEDIVKSALPGRTGLKGYLPKPEFVIERQVGEHSAKEPV